jgi:hypothetical protein
MYLFPQSDMEVQGQKVFDSLCPEIYSATYIYITLFYSIYEDNIT